MLLLFVLLFTNLMGFKDPLLNYTLKISSKESLYLLRVNV